MRSPVGELLGDPAAALAPAGVGWYLFGAQAAIVHGAARLTADVDVTVRLLDARSGHSLAAGLADFGFRLRVSDPAFIEATTLAKLEEALAQSDLLPVGRTVTGRPSP